MKIYSNFGQINQDLKILKLKKQISQEELNLNIKGVKSWVSKGLSPVTTISSMIGSIMQKAIVAKLVGAIFGFKRVKEVKGDKRMKV